MAFARGEDHLDGDEKRFPELVLPRPNCSFLFRVKDDHFASEGIRRGDLVVVERGQPLLDGRIALILVEGHIQLVRVARRGGRFVFASMPEEGTDVELLGIASRVIRLLLP
jgi:DNA polymerase V